MTLSRRARALGYCLPKVKVFRHVNLLEHIHKALLLGRTLNLVIGRNRYHLRVLAMIQIVATKKCHNRTL